MNLSEQFVMVNVSAKRKLVRLSEVSEIVAMVRLSGRNEVVGSCRGLLNLRGESVPVFDASGPSAPLSASRFILVSHLDLRPIGVIVDDVLGVITVPSGQVARHTIDQGRTLDCVEVEGQLLTVMRPNEVAQG